ncbi:hypothetical protein TcG_00266 [Trypanosoma cruzi]|nr:hypothetical protein TcG_00266 [Trypanosoma cruzi]
MTALCVSPQPLKVNEYLCFPFPSISQTSSLLLLLFVCLSRSLIHLLTGNTPRSLCLQPYNFYNGGSTDNCCTQSHLLHIFFIVEGRSFIRGVKENNTQKIINATQLTGDGTTALKLHHHPLLHEVVQIGRASF